MSENMHEMLKKKKQKKNGKLSRKFLCGIKAVSNDFANSTEITTIFGPTRDLHPDPTT